MITPAIQSGIAELLEMAGARPRGARRSDCPECGGRRTVAVDEERGLFCCHYVPCAFSGGIATLRERLGLRREWLPRADYLRVRREREQIREAARRLCHAVHFRRMELLDLIHSLNRLEALAHDAGPSDATWESLALAYRGRAPLMAELLVLECAGAADMVGFLTTDDETRRQVVDRVSLAGGMYDPAGKFVEVCP
jgi:hypothetical protein